VGTDPQFSPESATAKTAVSAAVLGSSAGIIPGSRLAVFPEAGHFPHLDAPRRFVEVLVDLMETTPAARVDEARWRSLLRGEPEPLAPERAAGT